MVPSILIIGGSDAGVSAALRVREIDPSASVTLLVADAFPNYSICGLPFYVSGEVADWHQLAHRTLADLEGAGISVRLNTRDGLCRHRGDKPANGVRPPAVYGTAGGGERVGVREDGLRYRCAAAVDHLSNVGPSFAPSGGRD